MGELINIASEYGCGSMNFRLLDPENPNDAAAIRSLVWFENNPDYNPNAHLSERAETDFLNYSWKCEDPVFINVIDELLLQIPFKGTSKIEDKRKHVEGIAAFLFLKSLTSNKWIGYSRKKPDYSVPRGQVCKRSRYEIVTNYSYDYTIVIVDYLYAKEYIDMEIGEWGRGRGTGNISRMRATSKLRSLFAGVDTRTIYPASESIVLRKHDENTGIKRAVEYVDTDFTVNVRANLKLVNEVLRQHSCSLYLPDYVPKQTIAFLHNKVPYLDMTDTYLRRKFVDNFETGGRFYGGCWQNLPNKIISFRSRIRIDGEPCTEIDYSNLHGAMAYNVFAEMSAPDGDLYHIPGFKNDKKCRKFAKQTLLRSFNVGSIGELRRSIANDVLAGKIELPSEVWTGKHPSSYDNIDYLMIEVEGYCTLDDAIERVLAYHPNLENAIFRKIRTKLQFLDSQLAEQILLRFTKEGKPCLPIHDSFVVKQLDRSLLKHVMISEYEKMFGFPIKAKVEF